MKSSFLFVLAGWFLFATMARKQLLRQQAFHRDSMPTARRASVQPSGTVSALKVSTREFRRVCQCDTNRSAAQAAGTPNRFRQYHAGKAVTPTKLLPVALESTWRQHKQGKLSPIIHDQLSVHHRAKQQ